MTAASTEGRLYHVASTDIDGERFVQVTVINSVREIVTRDHFTVEQGRVFAAEFIVATEC